MGRFKATQRAAERPGEGAFLVPEQFAVEERRPEWPRSSPG